jgi:hypothetical protein
MPWVKLLVVTTLSYSAAAVIGLNNLLISGLAVATLAGAAHTILRVLTIVGDRALTTRRK